MAGEIQNQGTQLDMSQSQPLGSSNGNTAPSSNLDMSQSQPIGVSGGSSGIPQTGSPQPSQQPKTNDEIKVTKPWYTPSGIAQRAGSAVEGLGEGALSTAFGINNLVEKAENVVGLGPSTQQKSQEQALQDKFTGKNNTPGSSNVYNKVGYGGETLAEFMLGDEALKGLSHADQLGVVSKWLKIAEKSPRLIRAIQTGADVEKVGAEAGLSPEAIQFVRSSPVLAKYLSIGVNALRGGAVQGVQTLARTGDAGKAAVDTIGTAATGGVLGTVAGAAAGILRKGGRAAQTISQMNDIAAGAPSGDAVEQGVNNAVNDAVGGEKGTLQNSLDDSTSRIGMFGEGAPQQAQVTSAAQEAAKSGKYNVSARYREGLNRLVEMSGGNTIPYENSPLHEAAKEIQATTPETAGPLDEPFQVSQPGSEKANRLVDSLANFGQEGEESSEPEKWVDADGVEHTEPAADPEEQVPADLSMQHLVARRQTLANTLRNLGPNDRADKVVYGRLLRGLDDTIAKLADTVPDGEGEEGEGEEGGSTEPALDADGQPVKSEARQHFDQMNADYKEGIRPFQNPKVKAMIAGNLNDVTKKLMGGQTSVADIADAKQAIGENNFAQIAKGSLQNIVQSSMDENGEVDYKGLFKKINKMNPDVRSAMFGDQGKALADALKTANESSNGLSEIGKQVNDLLGNGDISSLMQDPKRVKGIANLVGPEGMKAIGRSVFENQVREASTDTVTHQPVKFDPDKVLDWWTKLKDSPEVRDSLFTVDKDTTKNYNDMMKNLSNASSVKKLVKYGVLPLTLGTAGVIHGPGAALFGAVAGLGAEAGFGSAKNILDSVANNPRTWRALSFGGKVANKASDAVSQPVRNAGAAAIYKTAQEALGGNQ